MKKRFSDQQFIIILREAEAWVSARDLCRKHAISDAMLDKEALQVALGRKY
jgi:putative transposase